MQKYLLTFSFLIVILLGSSLSSYAQFYRQDTTFQQVLVKRTTSFVRSFIKLPGNKILAIGGMNYVNKVEKVPPIRLNEDGSFDDTFSLSSSGQSTVVVREDGKIVARDFVRAAANEMNARIMLYQPDGQLDSTFVTNIRSTNPGIPKALAVQKDNKVLVGTVVLQDDGLYTVFVKRVDTDGSIDSTFTTPDFTSSWISGIYLQSDGKVLVTGSFGPKGSSRKKVIRLNSDGSLDSSFDPVLTGLGGYYIISFQADGKILFGTDRGVVRLLDTGQVDDSFTISECAVSSMTLQADGKILVGCWVKKTDSTEEYGSVIRLNTDGSVDTSFGTGQGTANRPIDALVAQSNGQILVGGSFNQFNGEPATGIVRLNEKDGRIDPSFSITFESGGHLGETIVQPDSKLLILGAFDLANEEPHHDLARLHRDGAIDDSFSTGTGVDGSWSINEGWINEVALQGDGKILVGGYFSSFNGTSANSLVRLNEDGSVDRAFNKYDLEDYRANAIAVQNDGKILVGGYGYDEPETRFLTRLLPDGTLDPDFDIGEGSRSVAQILIQEDGKILVSGNFANFGSIPADHVVRFNSDGSLDETFQATGLNSSIKKMALQDDGKILMLGNFTRLNNVLVNNLVRLNPDGSLDETFNPYFGTFYQLRDLMIRSDGKIFVCGNLFNRSKKLVILNKDGSLDEQSYILEPNYLFYSSVNTTNGDLLLAAGDELIKLHTRQSQSITFDSISDKLHDDPPFILNATTSSDLPIRFEIVSGPATVEDSIVTLTGETGVVVVRAMQEGNDKFDRAQPKEQSFLVERVLGVDSGEEPQLKIYPNPASKYIFVESTAVPIARPQVSLYDMKGQKIPISLTITAQGYYIDLHRASKGIHILHLLVRDKRANKKIVVK